MKNIKNIIEQKYPPENPNDLWMKDNVLYKSTHKGWTPLTAGSGSSTNGVTSTTWQELKDKRDAGKLTPGALYRITDYNCTTTQENTRSAGHQFDIVLLALSEDKLAEEGWAMEHPTDVYDVTFADGVTKKCWIYKYFYKYNNSMVCNLISIENKLGAEAATFTDDKTASHDDYNLIINEENKTATYDDTSGDSTEDIMSVPNLPYNYFQNSNLSAWKVWYCLDNDKSRFAWADDASEESIVINSVTFNRYPEQDADGYYAWKHENSYVFTSTLTLKIGDMAYVSDGEGGYDEEDPIEAVSGFGRGVIYRLIDEWNNDVGYDFKNIVIFLGGKIEKGYLFSHADDGTFRDLSLTGIFNNVTVKKTIDDYCYCQVIDMGILVAEEVERCNIIVAGGALSEDGVNSPSSNNIIGYTIV